MERLLKMATDASIVNNDPETLSENKDFSNNNPSPDLVPSQPEWSLITCANRKKLSLTEENWSTIDQQLNYSEERVPFNNNKKDFESDSLEHLRLSFANTKRIGP